MATQWIVLFDHKGLDRLLALDELKEQAMINRLSGAPVPFGELNGAVNTLILRAQYNLHRSPEVWAYATADDIHYEEMLKMWADSPQPMADLVRNKGTELFKMPQEKNKVIE